MPTRRHTDTPRNAGAVAPWPQVTLRKAFTDALNEIRFEPPAPGEVWRLEFQSKALPVVVLEAPDESELVVAAVGEDPEHADAATIRLPADTTVLGFEVGVWLALEQRVPALVADCRLGAVDQAVWSRVLTARRALREDGETLGDGAPIRSELDPRLEYRSALELPLLELADAAWSLLEPSQEGESFWSYLQSHQVAAADLRKAGLDNPQLRALRRDRLVLTPDELARIAEVADRPLDEVAQAAPRPPSRLVMELHTPHRRKQLQESGLRHGNPPATERGIAEREVSASAMRTAGGEPDWGEALDQWFTQR